MVERASVIGRVFATTSVRRLILASLTIAAILLSLIGMHALSAGAGTQISHASHSELASGLGSPMQMMPGSDDSAPLAIASALIISGGFVSGGFVSGGMVSVGVVTAGGCTGMCAMNCLLLGMVCGLSLLVALTGVLVGKLPVRLLSAIRTVTRVAPIASSKVVILSAPSLNALSISRT